MSFGRLVAMRRGHPSDLSNTPEPMAGYGITSIRLKLQIFGGRELFRLSREFSLSHALTLLGPIGLGRSSGGFHRLNRSN